MWCSDHDPMLRMKGMHGVCLRPGQAVVELKVRLFNRTPFTQTFLWWANVATRVHEKYQSFFPTDVRYVVDHAKRAVTSFPRSDGYYYGVDYGERARSGVPEEEKPGWFVPDGSYAANDLSWYANIPVPTSYMITGTNEDFFGGYDHAAQAGVVHVANHHVAPGKKQWTWGNHAFGYAWDRSLTDSDGPYIELMAGVYTDNQPDFSYLAPWETKSFTQTWFPIHAIGVPQASNVDAALSLYIEGGRAYVGVCVTRAFNALEVVLHQGETDIARWNECADPARPLLLQTQWSKGEQGDALAVKVMTQGRVLIAYDPTNVIAAKPPVVAREPAVPEEVATVEELYLTGMHLAQYRHATRQPELYWREALRRDPEESRCHNAMGLWHLHRGEMDAAVAHFERAIARFTLMNPNPYDGEAYYNLGIAERLHGCEKKAYDALYKSTWNAVWRGPAYFALAEIDASRAEWATALGHVQRSLRAETDNLNARNLLAYVQMQLGDEIAAEATLSGTLALDPLDLGARWSKGIPPQDGQARIDLAFDLLRSDRVEEAQKVLSTADTSLLDGSGPIILLLLAEVHKKQQSMEYEHVYELALRSPVDYCFPSRIEELLLLERTVVTDPENNMAVYLLGNCLYDRCRHSEAIAAWEVATFLNPMNATVWRNLGIAYYNVRRDKTAALVAFDKSIELNPSDGRVIYERDQLWKRVGKNPSERLAELLRFSQILQTRDDLSVEVCTLYNQLDQPSMALDILCNRQFQPWEGGEGLVLGQYKRAQLLIGNKYLRDRQPKVALDHFLSILKPPASLREANHLLTNQSDVYYWIGIAQNELGNTQNAVEWWRKAARSIGDFQQMAVREVSNMSYWSGLAERQLGNLVAAETIFSDIYNYSCELETSKVEIDYFASSLPAMLLFEEDLQRRAKIDSLFLCAQALAGLNRSLEAEECLQRTLKLDPNHAGAMDLRAQLVPLVTRG